MYHCPHHCPCHSRCNALISALEEGAVPPAVPLNAELLSYFLLLHADQPPTLLSELRRAPAAVRREP